MEGKKGILAHVDHTFITNYTVFWHYFLKTCDPLNDPSKYGDKKSNTNNYYYLSTMLLALRGGRLITGNIQL